jgi:hypothetical protein
MIFRKGKYVPISCSKLFNNENVFNLASAIFMREQPMEKIRKRLGGSFENGPFKLIMGVET